MPRRELPRFQRFFSLPVLVLAAIACQRRPPPSGDGGAGGVAEAAASPSAFAPGSAEHGEALFSSRCALCHKGGGQGPDLGGVVGNKAASGRGYPYSRALRAKPVVWDGKTLDGFLRDPLAFAPGTRMPVPTPDAQERADLIAYLRTAPPREGVRTPVPLATATPPPAPPATRAGRAAMDGYRDDGPGVRQLRRRRRAGSVPSRR